MYGSFELLESNWVLGMDRNTKWDRGANNGFGDGVEVVDLMEGFLVKAAEQEDEAPPPIADDIFWCPDKISREL